MVYGWDISVHPRDENADADANEQLDNSRAGAAAAAAAAQTPTLQPVVKLKNGESASTAPSRAVRFSPRYGVLAVGGDELVCIALSLPFVLLHCNIWQAQAEVEIDCHRCSLMKILGDADEQSFWLPAKDETGDE